MPPDETKHVSILRDTGLFPYLPKETILEVAPGEEFLMAGRVSRRDYSELKPKNWWAADIEFVVAITGVVPVNCDLKDVPISEAAELRLEDAKEKKNVLVSKLSEPFKLF